jgi:hypothetical protein
MDKGALAALAVPGAEIAVRVTPGAARDAVESGPDGLRVRVTAPPEDGRATAAVQRLLARALGIPKSRLLLVRGATARDKLFRILP